MSHVSWTPALSIAGVRNSFCAADHPESAPEFY
jgi:hypothetical protein